MQINTTLLETNIALRRVSIIAGFQGIDENNNITTLGRGGSDATAVAIASSLNADVCQIYTDVDGIYTADPEKDKTATKYDQISYDEVYSKGLEVMDLTAFTLCKENNLPIIVFDMNKKGNLQNLLKGDKVGTLVVD